MYAYIQIHNILHEYMHTYIYIYIYIYIHNVQTNKQTNKQLNKQTTIFFPFVALGMTSYMFALEGTAANAYLIFLGSKFYRDRSNANARKIFLASLWYLPVLLSGFLIHSKLQVRMLCMYVCMYVCM